MVNKYQQERGLLPFNRRRIIDLAIREVDFLERWIADPFTPPPNRALFEDRLLCAMLNRERALTLKARLPPEWTGPRQGSML